MTSWHLPNPYLVIYSKLPERVRRNGLNKRDERELKHFDDCCRLAILKVVIICKKDNNPSKVDELSEPGDEKSNHRDSILVVSSPYDFFSDNRDGNFVVMVCHVAEEDDVAEKFCHVHADQRQDEQEEDGLQKSTLRAEILY